MLGVCPVVLLKIRYSVPSCVTRTPLGDYHAPMAAACGAETVFVRFFFGGKAVTAGTSDHFIFLAAIETIVALVGIGGQGFVVAFGTHDSFGVFGHFFFRVMYRVFNALAIGTKTHLVYSFFDD